MARNLAVRSYNEAMAIFDEGTPAMKMRLILGIQGHYLKTMNQQSPRMLEEIRDELQALLSDVGVDSSSPGSIYSPEVVPEDEDE